jgi:hypothetical protein
MKDLGEYNLKNGAYNSVISFGSDLTEKIHGTYSTHGIDGASPTRMTAVRSTTTTTTTSSTLQTDDIPGAQPRPHHITTSKLHPPSIPRNPLNPHYILPPLPPPPPPEHSKFIRDGMNVSDIAGARTKGPPPPRVPNSIDTLQGSPTNNNSGTGLNKKHRIITKNYDIMNVSDINNKPPAASQQQKLPSQEERNSVSRDHSVLQDFGVRKDYDWKSQKYASMRQANNSKQETRQQIRQALLPYTTPDTLTQLSLQLTLADKSRSGGVTSREFESVLKKVGMVENNQQGKEVSVLLSKVSGNDTGGLISYKQLLTDLYDATAGSNSSNSNINSGSDSTSTDVGSIGVNYDYDYDNIKNNKQKQEVVLPGWYKARQRRVATGVGLALLQSDQEDTDASATTTATSLNYQGLPPQQQTLYSITGISLLEKKKKKKKEKEKEKALPGSPATITSSPGANNDNNNDNSSNHWFAEGIGSDHPSSDPSWRPTYEMVRIVKEQRSYHPHLQTQKETHNPEVEGGRVGGKGGERAPVAAQSKGKQPAQSPAAAAAGGGGERKGPPSVTVKQKQKGNDKSRVVMVDDDDTLRISKYGGSRRRRSTKTTHLVREDIALVRALDFD